MPAKTKAEKEIKQLCTFYEQWKQDNQQMDFDDVLIEAYHLLKRDRRLLHVLQGRFQYVMVDEFQDTNPLQYELIKMIAHPHDHLCVVGDDDQTIYAFQGARHEIILGFEKQFKEAQSIVLSVNYRSTSPIVGLGNAVIQHNEVRKPKVLQATRTSTSVPLYFGHDQQMRKQHGLWKRFKQKCEQAHIHIKILLFYTERRIIVEQYLNSLLSKKFLFTTME